MHNLNLLYPTLQSAQDDPKKYTHLRGGSLSLLLGEIVREANRPVLIVAPDNLTASHLADDICFFNNQSAHTVFPDWETLPYDHFSPHQDIVSDRLSILNKLPQMKSGSIIATISTLMHRLPPRSYLDAHTFHVKVGESLNIDILRTKLTQAGYHAVSQVKEHGEFAIRGSIIDLFPMGSDNPFRLDLFDDEIETIRYFSAETQRTLEKTDEIRLLPAKEFPLTEEAIEFFRQRWRSQFNGNPMQCPIYQDISEGICSTGIEYYFPLFFDKTASFFDYLPDNCLIVIVNDCEKQAREFSHEIAMRFEQLQFDRTRPLLPPDQLFLTIDETLAHFNQYPRILVDSKQNDHDAKVTPAPTLEINHKLAEPLAAVANYIKSFNGRILFCVESTGRREVMLQLFNTIRLHPKLFENWQDFLKSSEKYGMIVAPIEEGFVLSNPSLAVITEVSFYGKRVMQKRLRKKSPQDTEALIRDLAELQIDDAIVHVDHGIGRYRGLETLKIGDQVGEFMSLEYQGGDKLYVPVASLNLISRYSGADPEHTPINKLGTDQWARAKRKASEKIRDAAAELLDLYAKRAARPGEAFQIPQEQYDIFATAFPFEETPDQLQAIEQVFSDMASDKPMDRVICGDVGFGKTEVALRAAFLCVQNGKQAVMLVPTTLLAQQHFQNFQNRFADWPIQVEMISRFRTAKEQKNILERIAAGKVDVVIGTHKLLQDQIQYKSLGLVIIDEEHRFGVKQKEKLKSLRTMVDMLTLTATPIPRTLNMALSGIRDLSVIATPPARRLSVKTFVHEYNDGIIKEALQREILRGGQVYFLHNDISTINKKAEEISKLVPEARPAVAHGQMHERELERIMSDFYHRHYNVLVCSTIIESGIDIPTANTIIINRADKFGIAQLHQLRGRVGRSHHQAYAYLLTPEKQQMTNDAIKRLDAISAYDDLGIGFTLATHDLEIRGAGELLGEEQSGDMQEVGFSLYMDMLSRAVDALKSGTEPDFNKTLMQHHTEVDLHISALIPDDYLADVRLRLNFYNKIANAKSTTELDEIQVEMIDRFGLLPTPLKNLIAVAEIKQKADQLGIIKIDANDTGGKFDFSDKPDIKPETIIKLIQTQSKRFKLEGSKRMRFTLAKHDASERIELVNELLNLLAQ